MARALLIDRRSYIHFDDKSLEMLSDCMCRFFVSLKEPVFPRAKVSRISDFRMVFALTGVDLLRVHAPENMHIQQLQPLRRHCADAYTQLVELVIVVQTSIIRV